MLLLLLKGYPGCGKSTVGDNLAKHFKIPIIDKDDAKDSLILLKQKVNDESILNDLSYEIMFANASRQLSNNLSVLVDSPLSKEKHLHRALNISKTFGAQVVVIECVASDACIWDSRLVKRAETSGEDFHKPRNLSQVQDLILSYGNQNRWLNSQSPGQDSAHHIKLDTTRHSMPNLIDTVHNYLVAHLLEI